MTQAIHSNKHVVIDQSESDNFGFDEIIGTSDKTKDNYINTQNPSTFDLGMYETSTNDVDILKSITNERITRTNMNSLFIKDNSSNDEDIFKSIENDIIKGSNMNSLLIKDNKTNDIDILKSMDNEMITVSNMNSSLTNGNNTKVSNDLGSSKDPITISVTDQSEISFDEISGLANNNEERREPNEDLKYLFSKDNLSFTNRTTPEFNQNADVEAIARALRRHSNENITTGNLLVKKFLRLESVYGNPRFSLVDKPSDLSKKSDRPLIFAEPVINNKDTLFSKGVEEMQQMFNPKSNQYETRRGYAKSTYVGVPMATLLKMLRKYKFIVITTLI